MTDWQDISTAPKDGTIVLLYTGNKTYAGYWGLAPMATAQFGDKNYPWVILDETNGTNALMDSALTCWAPLPKPPEAA